MMKKLLLTLGSIVAIAAPVAAVVACGSNNTSGESGFKEATVKQTEALEGLASAVRDKATMSFTGNLKVVKTEVKTDKARFTISTQDANDASDDSTTTTSNGMLNPAFIRFTVDFKQNKVTVLEEGNSIDKFIDATKGNEKYLPADLDTDIANARTGLEIANVNADISDFKVGAKFDYKAIAALLQKAKIDVPEIQDSGDGTINSELNESLNLLLTGDYTIKAFANGKATDLQHNGNDWAILLEQKNTPMHKINPVGRNSEGGKIIKFDSLYEGKWGKDFTDKIRTSLNESFILYIQDSQIDPNKVDIFGDLVSRTFSKDTLLGYYHKDDGSLNYDGTGRDKQLPGFIAEINSEWTKQTIIATELKYDGKPGDGESDYDFVLSANRVTDTK